MGVNVAWAPEGGQATCLEALSSQRVERGELLARSLLRLDQFYGHWALVSQRYRDECSTVGRQVVVTLGNGAAPLEGVAVAVDDDGHLVVRDRHGRLTTVAAGDVAHVGTVGASKPPPDRR
jgi:biotin-(acetyl-CoA carboxylase) ligase